MGLRARAWLTVPLAGVCLLAQLLSAGHLVIVRHEMCLEHGVAVDAGSHEHASTPSPANAPSPSRALVSREGLEAEHGHEHCLAAFERRDRTLLPPSAAVLLAAAPVRSAPALGVAVRAPGVALLLLAPKSSPPSA